MQEQPSWTDIWSVYLGWIGLGISFLSLVAAGIAAWKLLKRDKQRESEVDALILLAKQTQNLFELESTKTKPRFVLENHTVEDNMITIPIRNVGGTATILLLEAEIEDFKNQDGFLRNLTVSTNDVATIRLKITKPEVNERIFTEDVFVLHFTDAFGNCLFQTGHFFYVDEIVIQPLLSEPKHYDDENQKPEFKWKKSTNQ